MEAKREDNSLRTASEKNLYSTSQALFNIFQWMRLVPELHQRFFKDVRTFGIVLNNEDIVLRIHRAEKDRDGQLRYEFTEVANIRNYTVVPETALPFACTLQLSFNSRSRQSG